MTVWLTPPIGVGDGCHPVERLVFDHGPGFEYDRVQAPLVVGERGLGVVEGLVDPDQALPASGLK